jgi:hypothetical protein
MNVPVPLAPEKVCVTLANSCWQLSSDVSFRRARSTPGRSNCGFGERGRPAPSLEQSAVVY